MEEVNNQDLKFFELGNQQNVIVAIFVTIEFQQRDR